MGNFERKKVNTGDGTNETDPSHRKNGRDSSIKPFKHPTKREITYAVGGCFSCCKRRTTLKPWSLFEVSKVEAFEAIVFFGDGSEEARSKFELISAPKSGHFGAKYAIARTPQNGKIFLVKQMDIQKLPENLKYSLPCTGNANCSCVSCVKHPSTPKSVTISRSRRQTSTITDSEIEEDTYFSTTASPAPKSLHSSNRVAKSVNGALPLELVILQTANVSDKVPDFVEYWVNKNNGYFYVVTKLHGPHRRRLSAVSTWLSAKFYEVDWEAYLQ